MKDLFICTRGKPLTPEDEAEIRKIVDQLWEEHFGKECAKDESTREPERVKKSPG